MDALTPSDPYRLGRYWLAGRLGAGGQGVVYEAYDETGERVAVKVPRTDDPVSRARLAKEAAAARRVASFCTARVIEARVDVAQPYIVSEYVPGPSLRQVIRERGPYEGDALKRLAIGAATALTAIHQAGVVHRDLKPDNIILGPDGPRVIDFGVAREAGPTTTGPVMGTPAYMAPEILTGRGATAAADIWAWGLVVLFAASGRDAVQGEEPAALATAVLDLRPDPSGLAEPLRTLVSASLSPDPADRPSARDLLLTLLGGPDGDRLLAEGGNAAAPLTGEADPDLGTVAEELFEELSEGERAAAPDVFLRMIGADGTIRQVPRSELAGSEAVDSLLSLYGAAGLITAENAAYTLSRPALVQAWPRLRQWVAGNREGLPVHRRLTEAALFWEEHGRKPGDLLHGSNLDRTLRWAATERRDITLLDLERAFLDAAAAQSRRSSRRRGLLAAALAVLLVVALGGLGLAEYRRGVSDRQRDDATARSLALRAAGMREADPRLAMLLSAAAWRLAPSLPESRGALYESLSQPMIDFFADPHASPATVYALSRDGGVLAAVDDGRVQLWNVQAHRRLHAFTGVGETVVKAALSPDTRTLALQDDRNVRLWDVTTGKPVDGGFAAGTGEFHPGEMAFDRSGRLLAVPEGEYATRWWDVAGRARLQVASGAGLDAVSPDRSLGVVASTGGGRTELWDLREGKRIPASWLPHKEHLEDVEFSPDSRALAFVTSESKEMRVLMRRVPSGAPMTDYLGGTDRRRVVFSDRFMAHWGLLGGLVVQRRTDGQIVVARDLPELPNAFRLDESARVIRVITDGGRVHTYDVSLLFDTPVARGASDGTALLEQGGEILAMGTAADTRLWDIRSAQQIAPSIAGRANVLAFSPDGRRVATADTAGRRVKVADTASGRVLVLFEVSDRRATGVDGVTFSPDGGTLAVSPTGADGMLPVELRNLRTGSVILADTESGGPMSFHPDGKLLVAGLVPELLDPANGVRRPRPEGLGNLSRPYVFRPDGGLAAFNGPGGRISLWDSGLTSTAGELPAAGDSEFLVWSPDGRTLASYEFGDRIRLWDVPSRQPLGVLFDGLTEYGFGANASMAFSADGGTLYSATPEGIVRRHPLTGERAAAAVCERADRSLTSQEWQRYLPEIQFFEVCG
ncbi:protein kinase [Planomonospora sp. ID67723]|uniref:WD40 repeat domain-containing serine/threonine protein kinase n=1 Tax=Planomonospora sp. ID67723 TaxID=2738134 RepID=UPI0018C37C31|nr:serine/threonine-protein kinase [Planomonospora sp. ID67723]MBG0828297.1 protein kinase [Planomonospora sp. ID67723]